MPTLSRHVIAAVLLSSAAAAVADLRPPSLEDTTAFIATAVRQHQARPPLLEGYERLWRLETVFVGCAVETRVTSEVNRLGAWTPSTRVARATLHDIDDAAIDVADERAGESPASRIMLRCDASRACVDRGVQGRDDRIGLAFTSAIIAQRVAAALRHAVTLCRDRHSAGNAAVPVDERRQSMRTALVRAPHLVSLTSRPLNLSPVRVYVRSATA